MLNYEVDPNLLLRLIPPGTQLDSWNGKTFLSLVGFRFLKTKVWGMSLPVHRNFEEVNLRFYVRRTDGSHIKRGVVFIREIVPRWLIAAVARVVYNERYIALPMWHEISRDPAQSVVKYGWKCEGSANSIRVRTSGIAAVPGNNSQERFITEHYWGYAAQQDGGCIEYQVQHPPWEVWNATEAAFEGDMEAVYGRGLNTVLQRPPTSAFVAAGSAVTLHRGRRLPTNA
jgi:uncharacterized protein YqjF (DUF2071 family)